MSAAEMRHLIRPIATYGDFYALYSVEYHEPELAIEYIELEYIIKPNPWPKPMLGLVE